MTREGWIGSEPTRIAAASGGTRQRCQVRGQVQHDRADGLDCDHHSQVLSRSCGWVNVRCHCEPVRNLLDEQIRICNVLPSRRLPRHVGRSPTVRALSVDVLTPRDHGGRAVTSADGIACEICGAEYRSQRVVDGCCVEKKTSSDGDTDSAVATDGGQCTDDTDQSSSSAGPDAGTRSSSTGLNSLPPHLGHPVQCFSSVNDRKRFLRRFAKILESI